MSTEVWWTPAYPFKSSLTGQSAKELAAQWEKDTGKQWTQPIGYAHALWEVGFAALRNSDPKDNNSVRDAIKNLDFETVVGRVNMSMTLIDVTHIPGVEKGDEVVVIGSQGRSTISVASFSDMADVMNYEALVRLPSEIPRTVLKRVHPASNDSKEVS